MESLLSGGNCPVAPHWLRAWLPFNFQNCFPRSSVAFPVCFFVFGAVNQMRNICFTDISHLVLLHILFVLKVKLGTCLPVHRCAFGFNLKYIFVSLCK